MDLSEKQMEDLIAGNPEKFIEPGLKLLERQGYRSGIRFDLLFQDKFGGLLLVEIKRGLITRDAAGQLMEYYGFLRQNEQEPIEMMLIGNVIPTERRSALELAGITVKEIPQSVFLREMGIMDVGGNVKLKTTLHSSSSSIEFGDAKIALIGCTLDRLVRRDYEYFKANGKYWDGWTYKNIQPVEKKLREQISEDGYFLLYGYHSKQDRGDGRIKWKIKVENLIVFREKEWFTSPIPDIDPDWQKKQVYSKFFYQSLEQEDISIEDFFDVTNKKSLKSKDGSRLRNSFIIVRPI